MVTANDTELGALSIPAGCAAGPPADAGFSKTACAVRTDVDFAAYVGEAVPPDGAARSPSARVKPSRVDLSFALCVIAAGSVMVGADEDCEP